jgi:hypothetical protein
MSRECIHRVKVALTPEAFAAVDLAAEEEGVCLCDIVRLAVSEYLARRQLDQ